VSVVSAVPLGRSTNVRVLARRETWLRATLRLLAFPGVRLRLLAVAGSQGGVWHGDVGPGRLLGRAGLQKGERECPTTGARTVT